MTYINSGNAVFTTDHEPEASEVQPALEEHFGFPIPTLLLSGDKIRAIAAAIPEEWTNDAPNPDKTGQKSDVLYLFDDVNMPNIIEKLGYVPDIETMQYVDGAVITNVARAVQTKGSLQKLVGSELYSKVTIRNIHTARRLAELAADE
ncbi:hypothetical protein D3C87_1775780 [compost metagenome]